MRRRFRVTIPHFHRRMMSRHNTVSIGPSIFHTFCQLFGLQLVSIPTHSLYNLALSAKTFSSGSIVHPFKLAYIAWATCRGFSCITCRGEIFGVSDVQKIRS